MKNTYFMSKKIMNETKLNNLIYKMVTESLDALSGYNFESIDSNNNDEQNDDSKKRNNRRRQQIEAFFKQPGVNPAAYAYRLYRIKPVEGDDTNDMKNARSKFMKCLNHEKNQDGYEYAFDSSEVNTLFSMISGNELKENKISLSESDIMYMVNESVKRVLNELDWKTYANAARKRALQGDPKHTVKDLDSAANRELEKLYSIPRDNPYYNYKSSPELKTTSYHTFSNPKDSHVAKQEIRFPNHEHSMFQDYYESVTNNDEDFPFHNTDINLYDSPTDPIDRKSRPDLTNYISGKSKYIKGKGWQ